MNLNNKELWFRIGRGYKPEILFLILSVVFGLIFCFATVPFQVPDEFVHFFRAYQVSQLKFLTEVKSNYEVGGYLPQSFHLLEENFLDMTTQPTSTVPLSRLKEMLQEPLNPLQTQFFVFKNSAIYSPTGYLPQSLGLILGRFFGFPLLGVFYLGRISNLLVWIGLTYFAIRILPIQKWVMFVVALMPMTITQAASFSVDSILNGLAFLYIALVIQAAYEDAVAPGWKNYTLWIILLSLITLSKPGYFVFAGILLLIPQKKFGLPFHRILLLVLSVVIPLVFYATWISIFSNSGINLSFDARFSPESQSHWILSNTILYLQILIENYARMALPLLVSCIGYLGWLNQPLPLNAYPTFVLFFFFTLVSDHHYANIRVLLWQRLVVLLIILLFLPVIATSIYVVSNPVGYNRIDGIQGRYYIPLIPVISLSIYTKVIRIPNWILGILVPLFSTWFMVLALTTVLQRIQF